jgi:aspartyl-tRNA(Asn)/glutamyl-tRNA(Gln) amidotransferase subunit A
MKIFSKTISQIVEEVKSGNVSATKLVEASLKNIQDKKEYNAVISVTKSRAIKRAKEIDNLIKNNKPTGRLAGIPFIAKDNFLTFGGETTAGSNILKGFNAPYQATAIEKLEAEGAICVAKANLDAFGHGASTENSDFFTTKNPHDKTRVPGGSSGGSAVAVVLGMVPFALGTDTGGSIRQPSSFSGAVGYKPTYGLVSRSGVIAMNSSTDTIGPITNNVEDTALLIDIMSGRDPLDSTTIERDHTPYTELDKELKVKTVGVIKEYFGDGLDEGVKSQIETAIALLAKAGVKVKEVSIPSIDLALACYYIICPAEVSSNLSRYDGQRYGHSKKDAKDLDDSYKLSRSEGFGKEAKRRIMIGTYVLSSGYYDAYYKKAQMVRTKLIGEFAQVFKEVDFLLGPTAPTTAFRIGQNSDTPLQMYLSDIMTVAPSLVGIPAISVPIGNSNNLPVGLQLMAPQKEDRGLLSIARETERILQ